MLTPFVKNDGQNIVFTGHYLEIYIPEYYFEKKIAHIEGSIIKSFGLLHCKVFNDKNRELTHDILNLPIMIDFFAKDVETQKLIVVPEQESEPSQYRVMKFYKNDPIMPNAVPKDVSNVELFFVELMVTGKLKGVPYNKLLDIWEKNLELNNMRLGINATVLGVIISEIYRNQKNPDEKFAITLGKNPKTSQYDYTTFTIREICSRNSTFSALTFEDIDSMIASSLNMKNYNKKQVDSPLEKIIKM